MNEEWSSFSSLIMIVQGINHNAFLKCRNVLTTIDHQIKQQSQRICQIVNKVRSSHFKRSKHEEVIE